MIYLQRPPDRQRPQRRAQADPAKAPLPQNITSIPPPSAPRVQYITSSLDSPSHQIHSAPLQHVRQAAPHLHRRRLPRFRDFGAVPVSLRVVRVPLRFVRLGIPRIQLLLGLQQGRTGRRSTPCWRTLRTHRQ
ncbi:hypothetical protein PMAYCL1PPCAC_13519 [Pristionchus mayeri]|uniref:Uncharacterized protein n=1 Tax=Pristionchus mayeri TaxID=1317129 RepID=A0AAN5CGM0_9BILA|nr:hypothetical protein PMAYCL1PPCAC_13519 [Pristionchus mayeri]